MSYTKRLQILRRKMVSMLTGLIRLSLDCKCVFYRPEHKDHNSLELWS